MKITRRFKFFATHRLPEHGGADSFLHRHPFTVEATFEDVPRGQCYLAYSFGEIKMVLESILAEWEDAVLVHEEDKETLDFLQKGPHKYLVFSKPPSTEAMAERLFEIISQVANRELIRVRVYEGPDCWVDVEAP